MEKVTSETCSNCNSNHVAFIGSYGFYQCLECNWCWAYPEDDPIYEEMEEEIKYSYYGITTPDEPD